MFGLGMGELLVILAVALLVLGPKRLPEMATGLGKAIRDFRRATQDITSQLETDETVAKPLAELKSALNDPPPPILPKAAKPVADVVTAPRPTAVPAAVEPVHASAPVAPAVAAEAEAPASAANAEAPKA